MNNQNDVKLLPWPENIVADRHEVSGKWVLHYLTDTQAQTCLSAMNAFTPREKELEAKVDELEQMLETADPVYCPTCGHCGEEGCCGLMTKCKDAKPNHCFYGHPRKQSHREQEIEAQNKVLWEVIGNLMSLPKAQPCDFSFIETLAAIQKAKEGVK